MEQEQQISGQLIYPCKDCGDIYCKNTVDGVCVEKLSKEYCPYCKCDLQ